jgi:hypothetical protein
MLYHSLYGVQKQKPIGLWQGQILIHLNQDLCGCRFPIPHRERQQGHTREDEREKRKESVISKGGCALLPVDPTIPLDRSSNALCEKSKSPLAELYPVPMFWRRYHLRDFLSSEDPSESVETLQA